MDARSPPQSLERGVAPPWGLHRIAALRARCEVRCTHAFSGRFNMLTRFLFGVATSVAAVSVESIAGAQPTPASDNLWTGPYVGGNIGGTWGNTSLRATAAPGPAPSPIPPGDIAAIAGTPFTTNSHTAGFAIGGE